VFQDIYKLPGTFVLDGESVGDVFHAFDLLVLNGEDIRPLSYNERLTSLMNLLASAQHRFIKYATTAFSKQDKTRLLAQLKKENHEGVVFKRLDAPYTAGKPNSGGSQLKHKFYATLSAVVAKINVQRSVQVRLLNGEGWIPCGSVTIPVAGGFYFNQQQKEKSHEHRNHIAGIRTRSTKTDSCSNPTTSTQN
jgi:bifunctional non-homologous end joining protein LigD